MAHLINFNLMALLVGRLQVKVLLEQLLKQQVSFLIQLIGIN